MQTDLSVIFSTFGRPRMLAETLAYFRALDTRGIRWELLVVDNKDDAETGRVLESFGASLPIRGMVETRPGKNAALNHALDRARGQLVVFTDDDVTPEPEWLREVSAGAARWPGHEVFGGRILPDFGGLEPDPRIDPDHRFTKSAYVIADWDEPEGEYHIVRVWGPNMAVRASVFEAGHRFDENIGPSGTSYVMGGETEFLERIARAGARAVYLPEAVVRHRIRPEQLSLEWIEGRAFRYGRSDAYRQSVTEGRRRPPFGAFFHLGKAVLDSYASRLRRGPEAVREHYDARVRSNRARGYIYQYWRRMLPGGG